MGNTEWGFSTEQVHAGIRPDGGHGARITPVYLSNGFLFDDFDQARERFAGETEGYYYTRYGNPTIAAVERKLAGLEHGSDALAVASGQAALTVAFLTLLQQGDHVVSARSIYEGTRGLLREEFEKKSVNELTALLSHRARRVRLEAQFALAARGEGASAALLQVAQRAESRLARLHAIWGLG